MTEIIILDSIYNGFTIEYSNNIYQHETITKYIQEELLKFIRENKLYNLIPYTYDLKFVIYKTRDSGDIIYAESINKYTDYEELYDKCMDEIKDLQETIKLKDAVIKNLEEDVEKLKECNLEQLLNENKDIKDGLMKRYTENKILKQDIKRLEDKIKLLEQNNDDLKDQVVKERYKYNFMI